MKKFLLNENFQIFLMFNSLERSNEEIKVTQPWSVVKVNFNQIKHRFLEVLEFRQTTESQFIIQTTDV
jgi:hypothetical protein